MATKYAGQTALNKLMQIIKTALNGKADKVNATTSAAGLMSAADKTKLDGIAEGATKTTVDSTMSESSVNPVQNKAIKKYVDDHAADDAVLYTAQTLTYDQKFQARKNIGALSSVLPTTTGTVSMCPENVTDNNDAVHVTVTKYDGTDFTATLDCGPENELVRVNGIRTPTDADTNSAATVEYVKAKVASGGVTVDTAMSSTSTNPVQNKVVKSYVDTKVSGLQTAAQVQDAIKSAISGVYTPKGSIAFASLPVPVAGKVGWVYNITDAFTTDNHFIEGEGRDYPAGTNVVCAEISAGDYGWDVLAGTIDLTELTAYEVQKLWDSV